MDNENLKIFNVNGEYKMSEDETFKSEKEIALNDALKNLDNYVTNFLQEKKFAGRKIFLRCFSWI